MIEFQQLFEPVTITEDEYKERLPFIMRNIHAIGSPRSSYVAHH
jgi:hypothetical protein